ncbi:MAG: hypothetical protein J6J82_02675 [Alphaproteobacteria bacterium]|nr:hypothetical protein [Alphaproteobacteria bacterium]
MFSKQWFFELEKQLRDNGHDSDNQSFDEILANLQNRQIYSSDEFASHCAYVILAGGFSQKTAKRIHETIINLLKTHGAKFDILIKTFNNKNKINAICKIWENRKKLCDEYYQITTLENKLNYLQKLPHIGNITANHLARNLGEDIVKYDIWIQRLGCVFANKSELSEKINNGKLYPDIKNACDDMFTHLSHETHLPRGYIDVVLWKSLQTGLIKL